MKKSPIYFSVVAFTLLFVGFTQAGITDQLQPVKLASGMKFTEGPAWNADGYLVFSDIDGNVLYKWSEKGGLDTLAYPSGNSNGIICTGKNSFLVCHQGSRVISSMTPDGKLTPYIPTYKGKKFNSPNDLEITKKGMIYFSDPDFGHNTRSRELPYQGFYAVPAGQKEPILLDSTLNWPNGVAFFDDEKVVYLCESKTNNIYAYTLNAKGLIDDLSRDKKLFVKVSGNGLADGLVSDGKGHLFVAFNKGGIKVFDKQANEIGQIAFPNGEDVRNLCIGGASGKTLFVTAGKSLYKIELTY